MTILSKQPVSSLYSDIKREIQDCERTKLTLPLSYLGFVGVILGFVYISKITGWSRILLLLVIPTISLISLYQFSMTARLSAVLQGYAAALEAEFESNYAIQYCYLINEYIAGDKFRTNRMSILVFAPLLLVVNIVVIIRIFISCTEIMQCIVVALSTLTYLVISLFIFIDCAQNDKVRNNVYDFCKDKFSREN